MTSNMQTTHGSIAAASANAAAAVAVVTLAAAVVVVAVIDALAFSVLYCTC